MCNIKAQELKAAAGIASKDRSRKILCTVMVEESEDNYTVTATDSYMLFSAHRKDREDGMQKYIIDAEPLKKLKASDEFVTLTPIDDEYVKATIRFGRQTRTEIWPLVEGKYPNWRKILDEDRENNCGEFALSPDYLATIAKALKTAAKPARTRAYAPCVKMQCSSPVKPIHFFAGDEDEYLGIVMPIRQK